MTIEEWGDPQNNVSVSVWMVDPHNLDVLRGELEGVTAVTVTEGYYTDTRVSASVETLDDNYIPGSWLRIIVTADKRYEFGTFGVQSRRISSAPEGSKTNVYTLQSVLWMLDSNQAFNLFTVAKGAKAKQAIRRVCEIVDKEVIFQPGAKDNRYYESKVWERSDSYYSILYDICSKAGDDLNVDGHGRISIEPYVTPINKESSWVLNFNDPDGVVLDSGSTDTDDTGGIANRVVVVASNENSDREIVQYRDASEKKRFSFEKRGWTSTIIHDVQDMTPFTNAQALKYVAMYEKEDQQQGVTRDITCMFFPVHNGEVVSVLDGSSYLKYLVQTVDHDLTAWTSRLTMKELED